jgi:peptidoglycan/LPS O-acetylase OafA/YrhL
MATAAQARPLAQALAARTRAQGQGVQTPETSERTGVPAGERAALLPALTGLRFFAALWVVLFHLCAYWRAGLLLGLPGGAVLTPLLLRGDQGVPLFFVLSGFILAHAYHGPGGALRGSYRAFWVARVARIYPVYLLALVASFAPALWFGHHAPHLALSMLATPFLLQGWLPDGLAWNAPGWSLCTEAVFYAFFPLMLAPLWRLGRPGLLLLASSAAAVLVQGACRGAHLDPFWPIWWLPHFVAGIAAAHMRARGDALTPWCGPLAAALALALLVVGTPRTILPGALVLPFAALLLALARADSPSTSTDRSRWSLSFARLLGSPPLVLLGEASYALYLLHYPVWDWLCQLSGQPHRMRVVPQAPLGALLAFALLAIALTLALALLVLRLVEQPARRALVRRYAPSPSRHTPLQCKSVMDSGFEPFASQKNPT